MSAAPTGAAALQQVVLVTGKGGVGKTTVAAGFAKASRTKSTLVEFGDGEAGRRALGERSGVDHVVVEASKAIQSMAGDLFGSALLAKVVTGNFAMKRMLRAAPALRELAQLEAVRRAAAERPGQRVVVDMPATGHGVAWLRVSAQMRDLLPAGPLHELAKRLTRELVAPGRCSVVVVTLPERLVLEETIELCDAMRVDVGIVPARVVVNRVPALLPPHALAEATRLSQGGGELAAAAERLVELLASRDRARGEALDALRRTTEHLALVPVILPDHAVDPTADEVARWLKDAEAA